MRNTYYPKRAMLAGAMVLGAFVGSMAQTPVWNAPADYLHPKGAAVTPGASHDYCPAHTLTAGMITENGLQQMQLQGKLQKLQTPTDAPADRALRKVPVVFHIVYDNASATNVSDVVINRLLQRLNEDYRKANTLISSIRPAFTAVATDVEIEFCLATKDPSGAATTGINRRQTSLTWFNSDASNTGLNYAAGGVGGPNSMKGATYGIAGWDRTKYINIWICDITNGANSGTAGYAYVPPCTTTACVNALTAGWDGIVLDYNLGVQNGYSRAVSHEMGHFFGLEHTFADNGGYYNDGQSQCGPATTDDGFTDTPRIRGPFQNNYASCASATTVQSCTSGALWQYENLMDYSDCFCMFSAQQANYMNAMLSNGRNSLVTSTVTNCAVAAVAPVANFTGCNSAVVQGSTVSFTDASTGSPTSWAWSITPATGWSYVGGTSATSQNPQVQFTAQGTYTVALTATNAQGTNTKTSNACITVVAAPPCNNLSTPLVMGFELADTTALQQWAVENTNGDLINGYPNTWGVASVADLAGAGITATAHGGNYMALNFYNEDIPANDWLFTPCLSLTAGTTYSVKFWYRAMANYPEKMRVRIGTSANSTAMTQTIVDLNNITNTTWLQSTPNNFTVPTTGTYYIGFQAYSDADEYIVFLDDINISSQTTVVAPVANFTGCGNVNTGSTVTFTNTSTNSPTSYSWSITPGTGWSYTGGTSATSANPQVTFTAAGTYTVALTATNSAGSNTKTSSSCVVVSAGTVAPVANFTGCGSYSTGNTVTFTNTSTNTPTSYSWSITPGTGWSYTGGTSATSANPQVTFTTAGTYTVALTATNSAGSNTKTSSSCVVVTNATVAPVANFTGCGSYTVGNIVTFTNTSTNSPTTYAWSITPAAGWFFAGGTSASSANPQVVFTSAGSYTVALTATNSAGSNTKTSSNCVVATVAAQAPVADFTGCGNYSAGSTVTFTNTSTNTPTSYSWSITPATGWSFAGGTNATSPNPQVTFNTAGSYTVALTATNSAGSNTKTSNNCVVVSNGTVAPVAGFTGCGTYTTNSTVTFTNTSTNTPTSYSWSITPATGWSFTGGTSATSANPQVTFTTNGTYTVALTAGNSAGTNTATSTNCVVISSTGAAPVADFIGCIGSIAGGTTVTFANTSTNQPTSYLWSIAPATGWSFTGGTSATSASIQVQFTAVGPYTVSLTATNAQGSNTKTVDNCVSVAGVGIDEVAEFASGIALYPNPSTGMATLAIGNMENYSNLSVTVYNAVGVQVFKKAGNLPSEITLDLTGYSAGIYYVEVRSNEAVATKRLVLTK